MIISYSTEKNYRYLVSRGGEPDEFGQWLKNLGLNEIPYGLTLSDFVNEGWIQPIMRIDMPESYYLAWKDYPRMGGEFDPLPEEDMWSYYSDISWGFPEKDKREWFLHPYDRTESEAKEFVKHAVSISKELPPEIKHPNETIIRPYLWYFAHWQGYMLIDLLPHIIFCGRITDTKDTLDTLEYFKKEYWHIKEQNKKWRNMTIQKWENYKITFTWLSYYRTFLGEITSRSMTYDRETLSWLEKQGAKELAKHLDIDTLKFEENFTEHLLVLFQDWNWQANKDSMFHKKAIKELQREIYFALEWLCLLTGNSEKYYFEKWAYPHEPTGYVKWAELKRVLPYEFFETKKHFLSWSPIYLEDFNKYLPKEEKINNTKLENLYSELSKNCHSFMAFCRAFHNLHKQINREGPIDFHSNASIDSLLVFALRAEVIIFGILKKDVESQKSLDLIEILDKYKDFFNSHDDLYQGICYIDKNSWKMTGLRDFPESPFKRVQDKINKEDKLSEISKQFASHLLNFGIARNYFAHHSYLDDKMTRGENARLALVSPLVSVLFLSAAKLGIL